MVVVRAPLVGNAFHAPVESDGQLEQVFAPQLIHGTGLKEGEGRRRGGKRKERERERGR